MMDLIRPGLMAVRHYWKPFLLIDFVALLFVIGYFRSDAVRAACETMADWKNRGGLPAVMLMGAVSGALFPELAKTVVGHWKFDKARLQHMAFMFGLFALLGTMASVFYGWVNGVFKADGTPTLGTIVSKVLVDQFIYTPFVANPTVAFVYTLRDCAWSPLRAAARVGPRWYVRRVVPLLIPNWIFWIPMTSMMYSLSDDFIFCFAIIVQAAWCLLLSFVAAQPQPTELADETRVTAEPG